MYNLIMIKRRRSFLTVLIALVCLPLLIELLIVLYHDVQVSLLRNQQRQILINSQTPAVVKSRFDGLWGDSNHCDTHVISLYPIDLPQQIPPQFSHAYYFQNNTLSLIHKDQAYKIVKPEHETYYQAEGFTGYDFGLDTDSYLFLIDNAKKTESSSKGVLILEFSDSSYSSFDNLDYRCG